MRLFAVAFLTVAAAGCYASHGLDGPDSGFSGLPDAGLRPDTGARDLGTFDPPDMRVRDLGTDLGPPDLGPPDLGLVLDSGVLRPISALVVGYERGCAVRRVGTVACWGRGPLGDGTTADSLSAVEVLGVDDAVAASVGAPGSGTLTTCVVRASGAVKCWGENGTGTVGDGTTTNRVTPVDVAGIDDAVAIAISYHTTCAVRRAGGVKCWGDGHLGQLGLDGVASSLVPVDMPAITDATSIAATHDAFCVIHRGGTVSCWGRNEVGELGRDPPPLTAPPDFSVTPVDIPNLGDVVQLASDAGDRFAIGLCARRTDARVVCWAYSPFLVFGTSVPTDEFGHPELTALEPATDLAIAQGIACSVGTDGNVRCYGSPYFIGMFGAGMAPAVDGMTAAVMHLDRPDAVHVAVAYTFSCVLRATGQALCSGAPSSRGGYTTEPTEIFGL